MPSRISMGSRGRRDGGVAIDCDDRGDSWGNIERALLIEGARILDGGGVVDDARLFRTLGGCSLTRCSSLVLAAQTRSLVRSANSLRELWRMSKLGRDIVVVS